VLHKIYEREISSIMSSVRYEDRERPFIIVLE
jgi:hypothetical protein